MWPDGWIICSLFNQLQQVKFAQGLKVFPSRIKIFPNAKRTFKKTYFDITLKWLNFAKSRHTANQAAEISTLISVKSIRKFIHVELFFKKIRSLVVQKLLNATQMQIPLITSAYFNASPISIIKVRQNGSGNAEGGRS